MERKEIVVVDASVVVKWFVEEEYSKNARLLRDSYVNGLIDLTAPSLLSYEVINALRFSGAFGEEELAEIAKILDYYQITTYDLRGELALKTVEISYRKGVSIYDAAYVALSYLLDTILYTADEKLIQKIKDPKHVKHIYEYSV
jgi:predicted nucleic acid-binding protein